ncbi:ankyrin repeat and LEM domain-containing protein 1 [Pseudophryne corroboree]|uniref:ankyrin repeat and LEM domain-containing protein 1 n=1 Tax=Pseudophryne corroboree TaxID=495146 RepID=UPI003081CB0A
MAALAHKLCEAVENDDAREVENLLVCKADPNLILPEGIAAIHLASGKESESALRCLTVILQHGGDPNVRSIEALTPVHVAASWGCCKALIFLLRKGGDPTLQDQEGNTALELALMENNRRCVVALQEYDEISSDQMHGYSKHDSCPTDDITEMSSITHLLESSYAKSPFNSTKISPFMSPPRNVTTGKGMNDAAISSQIELSGLDTKVPSRNKYERNSDIEYSKLHFSVNNKALNNNNCELEATESGVSVKWMTQPACCYKDPSSGLQSDLIDLDNQPLNTEIQQRTVPFNTRTLVDSGSSEYNCAENKGVKEIPLSTNATNQECSAFKSVMENNDQLVLNHTTNLTHVVIVDGVEGLDVTSPDHAYTYNKGHSGNDMENTLDMCNYGEVAGGGHFIEHGESYSSRYNSCQNEFYTSPWENSYCSDKRGWDSDVTDKSFLDSHSNLICNQNSAGALSCCQKYLCKPSVLGAIETLPERIPGITIDHKGFKEGTEREHFDTSIQSVTLTVDKHKTARNSGISCTSQSPTLSVEGTRYYESESQDLKINLRELLLLTKGCRLNMSQQDLQTVHTIPVAEAEASCFDTIPVSVLSETKTHVEHDLAINQNFKDGSSSFSNTSADTLISESDEHNVKDKVDSELCEELRKMMLATKAIQSPPVNGERSPCFFTPRSKNRILSSKSRHKNVSLFEDSVEMPRRDRRVRSPDSMSVFPLQPYELGHTSPRQKHIEEQNFLQLASTNQRPGNVGGDISEQETTVNISDFLTDDLSSSETKIKSSLQFKKNNFADCGIFESEWLTEDGDSESIGESDNKYAVIGSAIEGKPWSESLVNGSFLHSTITENSAGNCSKLPRYSFSRFSCVPKIGNNSIQLNQQNRFSESGNQEVPLSPGGRPVNLNEDEPVEYLYMDNEKGHALIERHIPCKDQSTSNISENVDDTVLYDWRNYNSSNQKISKVSSARPPNRVAVELYRLSNAELAKRLRELGEDSIQVTTKNRKTCILLLDKHLKEQATCGRAGVSSEYSPELSFALRTFHIPECSSDEAALSLEFDQPDKTRKWREGVLKSSFNYLLLDPRVTRNLPSHYHNISQHDCFRTFVRAVFYVGKGKRSRPYCHLYEALTFYKGSCKKPCSKAQHILDIWKSGQGVLSLHCFQNTIPVEAYTREACMVDAMGLKMLTNQKKGVYYGQALNWTPTRQRSLGVHMLHRAMQIFLAEGERQLRPPDIRIRP